MKKKAKAALSYKDKIKIKKVANEMKIKVELSVIIDGRMIDSF